MKKKFMAVLLAAALMLCGSMTVWAAGEDTAEQSAGKKENTEEIEAGASAAETGETQESVQNRTAEVSETEDRAHDRAREAGSPKTASGAFDNGVTWQLTDGVLTISGNGVIPDAETFVLKDSEEARWQWRAYREEIISVEISEGITRIGDAAFFRCGNLKEVTIPDSVTEIGSRAFYGCSMKEIAIPDSVTEIGDTAFIFCEDLEKVSIPSGVKRIKSWTFHYCPRLKEVTIPDSVTGIGSNAFSDCTSLEGVTIPDGVTGIGSNAFENCRGLKEITIPGNVTGIGRCVFADCRGLEKVTILDGVSLIGPGMFLNCISLQEMTIPDSVETIELCAFTHCISLPEVTLSDCIKNIAEGAFQDCTNLKSIRFNGNAPHILGEDDFDSDERYEGYDEGYDGGGPVGGGPGGYALFGGAPFENVTATAYYPQGNPTWTEEIKLAYGDKLRWETDQDGQLRIIPEVTDNTYVIGSSGGATITCTGELKDFVSVYMDGVEVDRSNYTVREGSTVLTFLSKYLDTLAVGKHKVTLNYTYSSIDTDLTILKRTSGSSGTGRPGGGSPNQGGQTGGSPNQGGQTGGSSNQTGAVFTPVSSGGVRDSGRVTSAAKTGDNAPLEAAGGMLATAFLAAAVVWRRKIRPTNYRKGPVV